MAFGQMCLSVNNSEHTNGFFTVPDVTRNDADRSSRKQMSLDRGGT